MTTFTASEKMKMFPGKALQLAESFGFELPESTFVALSTEKKNKAYEMATVKSFSKTNGAVTVNVHILFDGQDKPVSAFSPENPNVEKMPAEKIYSLFV
jgi:hypothetical protein